MNPTSTCRRMLRRSAAFLFQCVHMQMWPVSLRINRAGNDRPQRFFPAAVISRSTSASVRYSRVRRVRLGGRLDLTVRFTVAGETSLRCELIMRLALSRLPTVRTKALYEQPCSDGRLLRRLVQAILQWTKLGRAVRIISKPRPPCDALPIRWPTSH